MHVFYAYTTVDDSATYAAKVRGVAGDADRYLAAAGGGRHFRWLCDSGVLRVTPIKVAGTALADFINAAKAAGHTRTDRIYTAIFKDGNGAGVGTIDNDDQPGSANRSNTGPAYSITRGFRSGTMLHELGHNIGAVQLSAIHSTGRWHCTDERDTMCYDDNGPTSVMSTPCPSTTANHFDCRDDDYYRPGAASILGRDGRRIWNSFNSLFLTSGSGS